MSVLRRFSLTGRLAVVFEAGDGRWMAICRGSGMTVRCLSPRGRLSRGFGWSGYPGLSLATTRAKCALSGQALERWKRTRLVLRVMTAPILNSRRRMVPHWARTILVPASPMRRVSLTRVQAREASGRRNWPSGHFHSARHGAHTYASGEGRLVRRPMIFESLII